MGNTIVKIKEQPARVFVPKMSNFETSSRYEGLSLKKENIVDYADLEDAELAFTAIRYHEYSSTISSLNTFNLSHLQLLHKQLFQDVFEWAGGIRTVDITKEKWVGANIRG